MGQLSLVVEGWLKQNPKRRKQKSSSAANAGAPWKS